MNAKQFYDSVSEAFEYRDIDAYASDVLLSDFWASEEDEPPLFDLYSIWHIVHDGYEWIKQESGKTNVWIAERFCIPLQTVKSWSCKGKEHRDPPVYVLIMIAQALGLCPIPDTNIVGAAKFLVDLVTVTCEANGNEFEVSVFVSADKKSDADRAKQEIENDRAHLTQAELDTRQYSAYVLKAIPLNDTEAQLLNRSPDTEDVDDLDTSEDRRRALKNFILAAGSVGTTVKKCDGTSYLVGAYDSRLI